MSICFSNWCLLLLILAAVVNRFCLQTYRRWYTFRRVVLSLVVLLGISVVAPIPGTVEIYCFSCSECLTVSETSDGFCKSYLEGIIRMQTRVLPFIIHGIPYTATIFFVVLGIQRYSPRDMAIEHKPEESSASQEQHIQTFLTALWFIIYYFPTAVLLLVLEAENNLENQEEVRSAKGMIKLAVIFRIMNVMANFFSNLLASSVFRQAIVRLLCRKCICNSETFNVDQTVAESNGIVIGRSSLMMSSSL